MDEQDRTMSMNNKASDSGYGSNKSNSHSQSQTSFGSSKSKSQHSSLSSISFESRQNTAATAEQQHSCSPALASGTISATTKGSTGTKRCKEHKKSKGKGVASASAGGQTDQSHAQPTAHQHIHLSQEQKPVLPVNVEPNLSSGMRSGSGSTQPSSPAGPSKIPASHDTKALQMAALTRALSCMKKFSDPVEEEDIAEELLGPESLLTQVNLKWQEYFQTHLREETGSSVLEAGFVAAVSMEDGVVVHLTPAITNVLGFPADMWITRSFIDFVHPKDRMAFASHIASGLSFPVEDQNVNSHRCSRTVNSEPFFCRMRQYRGLRASGFSVVDRPTLYTPFKLTMKLKEIDISKWPSTSENKENAEAGPTTPLVHLLIIATRVKSAYQYPEQVPAAHAGKFVTRHSASCNFGHIDTDAISYLGHLPQDLIGNSILDYYHPEDMLQMRAIYEGVMMEQGKPFRSKPYRFKTFNGTFALLETDWSCFINPWSGKLEFVIGQHRVVKGPPNPNVFMQPQEEDTIKLLDEVAYDCKVIQEDIKQLLTETVSRRLSDPLRHQSTRRRKDLAALMESLLDQMAKTENSVKSGSQCSGLFSAMARDSVMLGRLSPHHDGKSGSGSGTNQSSETAPSYSQLNYRENIERFFQSQPKTSRSDESPEKMETNRSSTDEENKSSALLDYSSGSNNRISSGSNGSGEGENFGNCCLTEDLLSRHNDNMEKCMVQRHKEHRVKTNTSAAAASQKDKHARKKRRLADDLTRPQPVQPAKQQPSTSNLQRLKRGTNSGWPMETRQPKLPRLDPEVQQPSATIVGTSTSHTSHRPNTMNLWPPFSISVQPSYTAPTYSAAVLQHGITNVHYLPQGPIPTAIPSRAILNPRINLRSPMVLVADPTRPHFVQQPVQYAIPSGVLPAHTSVHKQGELNGACPSQVHLFGQHVPVNHCTPGFLGRQPLQMHQVLIPNLPLVPNPHLGLAASPLANSSGLGVMPNLTHRSNSAPLQARMMLQPQSVTASASIMGMGVNILPTDFTSQLCTPFSTNASFMRSPSVGFRFAASEQTIAFHNAPPPPPTKQQPINRNNKRTAVCCVSCSDCSSSRDGTIEDSFSFSLSSYVKNGHSDENDSMSISFSSQTKYSSEDDVEQNGGNKKFPSTALPSRSATQAVPDVGSRCGQQVPKDVMSQGPPPSLDDGIMTPEVRLRFQLPCGDLTEILRNDLIIMKLFEQPPAVNQQLEQLYTELETENLANEMRVNSSAKLHPESNSKLQPLIPSAEDSVAQLQFVQNGK